MNPPLTHRSNHTRTFGGLGLGLAISRHLVELHGGQITAQSEGLGKGSTFTVLLPLLPVPNTIVPAREPAATPRPLAGLRLLVVDDDQTSLALMRHILERFGGITHTFASPMDALAGLQADWPDAVISDISMPSMDGYEFLTRLLVLRPNLPAIAVTAHATPRDRQAALAAGFKCHVAKPLRMADLVSAIQQATGKLASGEAAISTKPP